MAMYVASFLLLTLGSVTTTRVVSADGARYEPNWESLDSRPLPAWYDEAKVGVFVVWGLYAVPGLDSEWFWQRWKEAKAPDLVKYMEDNYKPGFTYADFGKEFTNEFFDPDQWADIFNASGAKYVVFTTKHHSGYTMWPSKYSFNWNSVDLGPAKDIVGALGESMRSRTNLNYGLYHSLFEWFHPLYLHDKQNNWTTNEFVRSKTMPELYEIVDAYKPDIIWSDGDWEAPDTYWNSTGFLAWLYNDSPVKDTVVTNDRWGQGALCHHGGFLTCSDRYNPGVLQKRKWENAMTIDKKSWGFRRNADLADIMSMDELIGIVVETVSCGGNILINVGPTKDGMIIPIFEERLRKLGDWLAVNGDAIYSTSPWVHQNDSITANVWYTSKKTDDGLAVYAILLTWPDPGQFVLGSPTPTSNTQIRLLGYGEPISWSPRSPIGINLNIPVIGRNEMPCSYGWVLEMTNLSV